MNITKCEYARLSGRAKEKHCLGEVSNLSQTDHQDPSLKGGVFFKQDNLDHLAKRCGTSLRVSQQEIGGVIVLFSLVVFVLMFMIAITIDIGRISASHSQEHSTAGYIALGALEAYFKTDITGISDPAQQQTKRLQAAFARAGQVGNFSFMVGQPGVPLSKSNASDLDIVNSAEVNGDASRGKITYGAWHFLEPVDGCTAASPGGCPCKGPGDFVPCFQASTSPNDNVNAFHVELYTHSSNPVSLAMGTLIRREKVAIAAEATAAITPRRMLFLLDLSRSMVEETHPLTPVDPLISPSLFALPIKGAPGCTQPFCECFSPADTTNPCTTAGECGYHYTEGTSHNFILQEVFDNRTGDLRPPELTLATKHFKDDYSCHIVDYTDGGVPKQYHLLVDTEYYNTGPVGDPNTYIGPQPMSDLLLGMTAAVEGMKKRVVPGDMIGVIGFDHSAAIAERILPLAPPGTASFDEVEKLVKVDPSDPTLIKNRIDRLFLPMPFANTAIPHAFSQARDMFIEKGVGNGVQNMMIVFSDGYTNCDKTKCENTKDTFNKSYFLAKDLILDDDGKGSIKDLKVVVHFVLIGEKTSGPHTVVRTSQVDGSRCMTEGEARNYEKTRTSTLPTWRRNSSNTEEAYLQGVKGVAPWYNINKLWHYPRLTGGYWLPLRPPCEKKSCTKSSVQECLDDLCAASPSSESIVLTHTEWTDERGRLACDPLSRSKVDQLKDMMKTILERHPYVLVD